MKLGLVIYGSLDTLSGGYLYDRKLVEYLRSQGDIVEIISLPWRNYASHLTDNFSFKLSTNLDILIQDELNHPSLIWQIRGASYPVISHPSSPFGAETWQWQNTLSPDERNIFDLWMVIFNWTTTEE
jgi:hypothetical protein